MTKNTPGSKSKLSPRAREARSLMRKGWHGARIARHMGVTRQRVYQLMTLYGLRK